MNDLTSLTSEALQQAFLELRKRERQLTVEVLDYLSEVERRELYVELGHSSMFSYCMERLRYSESGANRRIRSARAMKRFGEIRPLLLSGELNLSTLSAACGVLNEQNATEFLKRISGRSKREVESILCEVQKRPRPVRESVRPVAVRMAVSKSDGALFSSPATFPTNSLRSHQRPQQTPPPPPPVEKRFEVKFSLTEEAMTRFQKAQALLSNRLPNCLTLEATVDALVLDFLKRHDPVEREERRKRRKARVTQAPKASPLGSRHIAAPVRDAVFMRDGGSCSYVSPDGRRCGSTMHLELDHVHPFATGGTNEASNLRVVCRRHNQHAADKAFGRALMDRARGKRT